MTCETASSILSKEGAIEGLVAFLLLPPAIVPSPVGKPFSSYIRLGGAYFGLSFAPSPPSNHPSPNLSHILSQRCNTFIARQPIPILDICTLLSILPSMHESRIYNPLGKEREEEKKPENLSRTTCVASQEHAEIPFLSLEPELPSYLTIQAGAALAAFAHWCPGLQRWRASRGLGEARMVEEKRRRRKKKRAGVMDGMYMLTLRCGDGISEE